MITVTKPKPSPPWEPRRLPHTFSLQEVAAIVLRNDLQACSNRESQQGDKRILESNAVHIVNTCPGDKLSCGLVGAKERIEDCSVNRCGRLGLPGRLRPRPNRRPDIVVNEPLAYRAEKQLRNR